MLALAISNGTLIGIAAAVVIVAGLVWVFGFRSRR